MPKQSHENLLPAVRVRIEEGDEEDKASQSILAESTPQEQEAEKPVKWSYRNYNDINAMKLLRLERPKTTLSSIQHKIDWYLTKADKNTTFKIEQDVLEYWREKEQQLPKLARLAREMFAIPVTRDQC